ncbi:glycerophosphoryl diester phosphodiesterase [Jannaschia pagri]|uniref:glycerophosphodiester phosphodiesterase n=1 Tax=Jannaschia pagri TaxID=2829797 RepID=A0ABQ4NPC0_9RHOB|nr:MULTISPECIES: glycerophosphodiester phosphodiesterase family protein [unclassified Jannaschia]GIT92425.1 glycerophosphoryl diester phosphodiesterase [Jannaschia sp. AI_61]GIT96260.1 glycerophosphoryl diester phosphodiesterase [Jannaschia sp. AI_62]
MTLISPARAVLFVAATAFGAPSVAQDVTLGALSYGPRPAYLIDKMAPSALKDQLQACLGQTPERSDFSIGHRGAPLMFPEHTVQSNLAAARMGAGILECDVTFTSDHELVCRHAQNDLHTTTNILVTPLAETCAQPFTPASGNEPASAECRTSDITLEQFRSLTPKMDGAFRQATTPEAYQGGTSRHRTDLYASGAELLTHAESIALFSTLGAKFTPELKAPVVEMPHNGFSQRDYAQALIDDYKAAGVPPEDVWPQSFQLEDILYWIEAEPAFGAQAVYLMDEFRIDGYSPMDPETWPHSMQELHDMGLRYIAPPLWMLVTVEDGKMVPSTLAMEARAADLKVIAWTLERSGPLDSGGGWYYQSVADLIDTDGDMFELLHVLAQDAGVVGVFSDWPATTTFYANCMGL